MLLFASPQQAFSQFENLRPAKLPESVSLKVVFPNDVAAKNWPVRFGIPFSEGLISSSQKLGVVDDDGRQVPAQFDVVGSWADGSLRWVHAAFVADRAKTYRLIFDAQPAKDVDKRVVVEEDTSGLRINTGPMTYTFEAGLGMLSSIATSSGQPIVSGAGEGFYIVDSQGRRATLKAGRPALEVAGPLHVVVRTEGRYTTDGGTPTAAGVVYFHFFAGRPEVHISHKLIVTEETLDLWFRDIGLQLPVEAAAKSTFNTSHQSIMRHRSFGISAARRVRMVQHVYPHFGKDEGRFTLEYQDENESWVPSQDVLPQAAGNWVDVGSDGFGIAAQMPGFVEQFPSAFVVDSKSLTIKFWASEAGQELDYRTKQVMDWYFGHDWFPADHPATEVANTARGTSKTHDLWLYPRAVALDETQIEKFGAAREGVFALPDPAWTAATYVMGPWRQKDAQKFPGVEQAIENYFDRGIFISKKVFPTQGYLYDGMYPYVAQPWEFRDGRWYPTPHRTARSLEYNLKRSIWVLAARSAEADYYHYARRYTRFAGNMLFSSWDAGSKPKGWMVQGNFHSPIVWGSWSEAAIRAGKKPAPDSPTANLTYASSEDVIQFVYDWFLAGDFQSRDHARLYQEALLDEMEGKTERALQMFPAVVLLRPIGSIYELEHNERVFKLGHDMLSAIVLQEDDPSKLLNEDVRMNYGKMGEVFMAFYYYYVSTGDERAKDVMTRLAEFVYEFDRLGEAFGRQGKASMEAFAMKWWEDGDPAYARWLAQWMRDAAGDSSGPIDIDNYGSTRPNDWGQITMTGQDAMAIGLPVAMRAVESYDGPKPQLPLAKKLLPVRDAVVLMRKPPGEVSFDIAINNVGDLEHPLTVKDADGAPVNISITRQRSYRMYEPKQQVGWHAMYSPWYMAYETQSFYRVVMGEDLPAGVYEIDPGDDVAFTLVDASIDDFVIASKFGLLVERGRNHYFKVPAGVDRVRLFAHRAIEVQNPNGEAVELLPDDSGGFAFNVGHHAGGVWGLITLADDKTSGATTSDTFVRFNNIPNVMAMGHPSRLFNFDATRFAADKREPIAFGEGPTFAAGVFGKAIALKQQFVELPIGNRPAADASGNSQPKLSEADAGDSGELGELLEDGDKQAAAESTPAEKMASGTFEFWYQPQWSASDYAFALTTRRLQLAHMPPLSVSYYMDPDNQGRTGRYSTSQLHHRLEEVAATRTWLYPQAGRWYHIAVTWQVDGSGNRFVIFVNGRRRAHHHYDNGVPLSVPVEKLAPIGPQLRLGSCLMYGRPPAGGLFDELRVSDVVRYREDFDVPAKPWQADEHTRVLMHFDGNLDALKNDKTVTADLVAGRQMDQ